MNKVPNDASTASESGGMYRQEAQPRCEKSDVYYKRGIEDGSPEGQVGSSTRTRYEGRAPKVVGEESYVEAASID